jgi:hypothetical protein
MRLMTVPHVRFSRVAYAGNQALVSLDYGRGAYHTRWWDLTASAQPVTITPGPTTMVVWILFIPGGERFLRKQGLWPDEAPLPLTFPVDPNQPHPLFARPRHLVLGAVAGDGATRIEYQEGHIEGRYRTRFHLREPGGDLHPLYCADCMFGARANFSPDARLAAMSAGDRVVSVWDLAQRRELGWLQQSDRVLALAFVADTRLVIAAGRTVHLWDVRELRSLFRFPAFRKYADALAVSPDRRLLAAGSRDGVVRLWDTVMGREVGNHNWGIGAVKDLAFAPDGTTAAAAGDRGIAVWDID